MTAERSVRVEIAGSGDQPGPRPEHPDAAHRSAAVPPRRRVVLGLAAGASALVLALAGLGGANAPADPAAGVDADVGSDPTDTARSSLDDQRTAGALAEAAATAEPSSPLPVDITWGAPPLDAIHAHEGRWYTLDNGDILVSGDLVTWTRSPVATGATIAIDSSGNGLRTLESGANLVSFRTLVGHGTATQDGFVPLRADGTPTGPPEFGALRDDTWVAGWVESSPTGIRTTLQVGSGTTVSRPIHLGGAARGVAATSAHVVVATRLGPAGTAMQASQITRIAVDGATEGPTSGTDANSVSVVCHTALAGDLTQTPDGTIHHRTRDATWIVEPDAAQITSVISDADLDQLDLGSLDARSIEPIASGGGWSILATHTRDDGSSTRRLWITKDGRRLEELDLPDALVSPGHVAWASLGANEGVGVRTGGFDDTGLVRLIDSRYWHPRPHDLARVRRIEPAQNAMTLATTTCETR